MFCLIHDKNKNIYIYIYIFPGVLQPALLLPPDVLHQLRHQPHPLQHHVLQVILLFLILLLLLLIIIIIIIVILLLLLILLTGFGRGFAEYLAVGRKNL